MTVPKSAEILVPVPVRRWRRVMHLVGPGKGRFEYRPYAKPPSAIFFAGSPEAADEVQAAIKKRQRTKPNPDRVGNLWPM